MPIRSLDDMRAGGRPDPRSWGRASYWSRGGTLEGSESIDVASTEAGSIEIRGPRLPSRHTHGTGCTLSSAIAANLANGMDDEAAIRAARDTSRAPSATRRSSAAVTGR